ncbi:GGDEF domain-containing protein [Comamonas flocculans]|uniref:diguanylate cyclase n=1 Tax=Comamonas flocculans TaxID=2597701 RepID=A0A5B8S060_9BURK|nr:GGDEF domain-containing protein [Comamonas flocculans]QEA13975.1 diguanylate cyclase [Comamonas flocculans]
MVSKPASEYARETLKQIAARRLQPTPDNYQAIYDEISGQLTQPAFPQMRLRQIARVMPGQTPGQQRLLGQLEAAVEAQDWTALQRTLVGYAALGVTPVPVAVADKPGESDALNTVFAEHLARLIDNVTASLGEDDERVRQLGQELIAWLRQPMPALPETEKLLSNFSYRLSFAAEDQSAIRATLLMLLHMVFDNVAVLSQDDAWLQGQAQALRDAAVPPLTLRRLDDVQQRLKDVIFKQSESKARAIEAQRQMRELLATFIDRLAQMDESSAAYHSQLSHCAERISQVADLQALRPVLQDAMSATQAMAQKSQAMRTELHELRQRADTANAEIERLRQELERTSAQARHDPLTGALNRKGMEEALRREISGSQRHDAPLCVALLDLDNFKALNDRYGHAAGDGALLHLANVTRSAMRPQDQLARYGGEEFVLVLPGTTLEQGVEALKRLQRELSTHYFLSNEEHVLITFSAGVAQLAPEEEPASALRRADQAMYLAKRAGKNRVVAA